MNGTNKTPTFMEKFEALEKHVLNLIEIIVPLVTRVNGITDEIRAMGNEIVNINNALKTEIKVTQTVMSMLENNQQVKIEDVYKAIEESEIETVKRDVDVLVKSDKIKEKESIDSENDLVVYSEDGKVVYGFTVVKALEDSVKFENLKDKKAGDKIDNITLITVYEAVKQVQKSDDSTSNNESNNKEEISSGSSKKEEERS